MPQALPLTTHISQSSSGQYRNRVLQAQFGDGYDQSAPDGINNRASEWSVRYDNLTTSEKNTLVTALNTVGSWDYLTWAPPGEATKKFKVTRDGYSVNAVSGDLWNISFTLAEVF
jgi:phage-related protein